MARRPTTIFSIPVWWLIGWAGLNVLILSLSSGIFNPNDHGGTVESTAHLTYLTQLPEDYDSRPRWPLLLFLHGAGERGGNIDHLWTAHGPPKLFAHGREFPFIVVSPHCPDHHHWEPEELLELVDAVVDAYNVDEDQLYVTGLSMGGFGTWGLAAAAPDRFAAIAPICGGGDTRSAGRIAHMPIWVFHGAKDDAVPLSRSLEMVEALNRVGGNVRLTVYPDAAHDSWTETYDNAELYDWLLSHRLAENSHGPPPNPAGR